MTADLDRLLEDAGHAGGSVDPDELWRRGRRRRRWRQAGTAGSVVAALAAVALVVPGLLPTATPQVAPLGRAPETPTAPETDAPVTAPEPDLDDEPADTATQEPEETAPSSEAEDAAPEAPASDEPTAVAPDPDAVAAPCAPHQHREQEAFIELAAPVPGQTVDGTIELVGCANVYEATVRYRLSEGAVVHVDDFTTATCGTGCVGEFRDTIAVPSGSAALTLEVFWEDAADGQERDVVTVELGR